MFAIDEAKVLYELQFRSFFLVTASFSLSHSSSIFYSFYYFDKTSQVELGQNKFSVIKTFRLFLSESTYSGEHQQQQQKNKAFYYLLTGMCTYMTTVHYENWNKLLCIRWCTLYIHILYSMLSLPFSSFILMSFCISKCTVA
jgi:hypothetical protein